MYIFIYRAVLSSNAYEPTVQYAQVGSKMRDNPRAGEIKVGPDIAPFGHVSPTLCTVQCHILGTLNRSYSLETAILGKY